MGHINRPGKQAIREWLRHRQLKNAPPPDIAQIRRELGWARESSRHAAHAGEPARAPRGAIVRRDDAGPVRLSDH